MKDYQTENIRNICLGAHSGAGKTSLSESLVFGMGVTNRLGTIEIGTSFSDYNDDEIERQISISSSLLHGEWNSCKVNLIEYNPIDASEFQQANPQAINNYISVLEMNGIIVNVRRSRGKDIDAACGQLAVSGSERDRQRGSDD